MSTLPKLGEGDEYELCGDVDLVHADEKTLRWRKQEFVRLGFSMAEAQTLSVRRAADLRDIERWLTVGPQPATHAQVLLIVAPLVETPPEAPE